LNIAAIGGSWELRKYGNWVVFPGTPEASDGPLGDYARELGYRTMTTLGNDYSAGYGHVAGPVDRFRARGGSVVQQQWVPYGTVDYAPYLAALKAADVFFQWTVMPDLAVLVKQYYEHGVKIPMLIGEAEGLDPEQLKQIGPKVVGAKGILRGYSRRLDNPVNRQFVQAFKKKYDRYPGQMDGFAYACMSIYLAGLEATRGDARLKVLRPALLKLEVDTPVGPVSFSRNGYALSDRYLAEVKVIDGEYVWEPFRTIRKVRDPRDE
jgi:branched-chain amino acid transport system substrate-binding protein